MPTQSGVYHETYASDYRLRTTTMERVRMIFVVALVIIMPLVLGPSEIRIVNQILIAIVGAVGLNILTGYTGQISLGQGAFLAIGAYGFGLSIAFFQLPWFLALLFGAAITAVIGGFFGLPSLRLKGLYLAVATLAAQVIVEWIIKRWDPIDGELDGRTTDALRITENYLFGNEAWRLNDNEYAFYWFALVIVIIVLVVSVNLFRTHIGRAFIAIRDQDIAAEVMGVNIFQYKLLAFAISSFLVGLAGAMLALHSTAISFERFTLEVSIQYLAMIIIGGLGSISGSVYGAIFIVLLPELLRAAGRAIAGTDPASLAEFNRVLPFVQQGVFGAAIVVTLIIESGGIKKLWQNIKDYFRLWPFNY